MTKKASGGRTVPRRRATRTVATMAQFQQAVNALVNHEKALELLLHSHLDSLIDHYRKQMDSQKKCIDVLVQRIANQNDEIVELKNEREELKSIVDAFKEAKQS